MTRKLIPTQRFDRPYGMPSRRLVSYSLDALAFSILYLVLGAFGGHLAWLLVIIPFWIAMRLRWFVRDLKGLGLWSGQSVATGRAGDLERQVRRMEFSRLRLLMAVAGCAILGDIIWRLQPPGPAGYPGKILGILAGAEYLWKLAYPIGSGMVEGACRHLVKDRMEQSGMRWKIAGAQAVLSLRAIYLNDD
jgi:hypothetical protein